LPGSHMLQGKPHMEHSARRASIVFALMHTIMVLEALSCTLAVIPRLQADNGVYDDGWQQPTPVSITNHSWLKPAEKGASRAECRASFQARGKCCNAIDQSALQILVR
jgi:hypothetical protein